MTAPMSNPHALQSLADRLAAATGPSRDLDADVYEALGYEIKRRPEHDTARPRYCSISWRYLKDGRWQSMGRITFELDAALSLVEKKMPGQGWSLLYSAMMDWRTHVEPDVRRRLPLALLHKLIAALMEQSNGQG